MLPKTNYVKVVWRDEIDAFVSFVPLLMSAEGLLHGKPAVHSRVAHFSTAEPSLIYHQPLCIQIVWTCVNTNNSSHATVWVYLYGEFTQPGTT